MAKKEKMITDIEDIIGNSYSTVQTNHKQVTELSESTVALEADKPTSQSSKSKLRKSLEEYRELFLITPKITNRKTVFISEDLRDSIDDIARKLGNRKMSVSGFLENLVRQHLATYQADLEKWKRL